MHPRILTQATHVRTHILYRFATVLADGEFARSREADAAKENEAKATALTDAVKNGPSRVLEVRSCFGGMAVYRADSLLGAVRCNYSLPVKSHR